LLSRVDNQAESKVGGSRRHASRGHRVPADGEPRHGYLTHRPLAVSSEANAVDSAGEPRMDVRSGVQHFMRGLIFKH